MENTKSQSLIKYVQGELIFTLHGLQSPVPMPVLIPTLWFAE
jgi:hypothetical protein